jgi:hypothetical protein
MRKPLECSYLPLSDEGWRANMTESIPVPLTTFFSGKVYKDTRDPKLMEVLKQSVEFSSYFVYPNGFYAGSLGSRNTLHFYPHGYEILSLEIPMACAIADKMRIALGENKLVPPEIISDRYVFYRVPEFLMAYLDCDDSLPVQNILPFEKDHFNKYFERSRIQYSYPG